MNYRKAFIELNEATFQTPKSLKLLYWFDHHGEIDLVAQSGK